MNQFAPVEIANWIAIYVAAGLCCSIAMALSVTMTIHGAWQDKIWQEANNLRGMVLFLPKLWWRWQKLYLFSTPVTLGIVGSFAASLTW